MDKINKLPELQSTFSQGRPLNGISTFQSSENNEVFSWGPEISTLQNTSKYNPYDFFTDGYSFNNHVSVSNNKDNISYYLSAGRSTAKGVIPTSELIQNTFSSKVEVEFFNKFNISNSILFTNNSGNLIPNGANISGIMFGLLTTPASYDNANGLTPEEAVTNFESCILNNDNQRSYSGLIDNPYWTIQKNLQNDKSNRIIANINPSYDITDYMYINYVFGIDVYNDKTSIGYDKNSSVSSDGLYIEHSEEFRSYNSNLMLNFEKFYNNFNFNAFAGYNFVYEDRNFRRFEGNSLIIPGDLSLSNSGIISEIEDNYLRKSNRFSGYAASTLFNMWNLDFNFDENISSTMPKENNKLTSFSGSTGIILTEFIYTGFLNFWKIFTSYNSVEKEAPLYISPEYFYSQIFDLNSPVYYFDRRKVTFDENLKAEKSNIFEIGTDIRMFNARVKIDFAYFNSIINNQIIPKQISNSFIEIENGGTLKSQGFEFTTNLSIIDNYYFTWDLNYNFSKSSTVVSDLNADIIPLTGFNNNIYSALIEGQPYGVLYGTKYMRNTDGQKIIDEDGFPVVDSEMGIIGNPNPDWKMGINNTFGIFNFTISVLFDIKKGGDMWNGTSNTLNYFGVSKETETLRNTTNYIFEGVKADGTENDKPIDFANAANGIEGNYWYKYGILGVAEDAIEDASWIRLQNLKIGYSIPKKWFCNCIFEEINIQVYANNLLLFTKYSGVDPETNLTGATNGFGLEYFNMPNTKSYGGSIAIKF
jgi:hypothetical protein